MALESSVVLSTIFGVTIRPYIKSYGGSNLMANNVFMPVARECKEDFQRLMESIRL